MKKLIYIATMALGVLATSCADDFLATEPTEYIDSGIVNEIMAADLEQMQAYIAAGYDEVFLAWVNAVNGNDAGLMTEILVGDLMSGDLAKPTDNYGWYVYDYQSDYHKAEWMRASSFWTPLYYAITNSCNPVIAAISTLSESELAANETAQSLLYQAYALRAFSYFRLINYFQHPYQANPEALGVPIIVEDVTKNVTGRAPVKDVYTLINSDIEKAYNLAKGKGMTSNTTFSEYSIALLWANIALFTGDYEKAAEMAEVVMSGVGCETDADALIWNGFNDLNGMSDVIFGYDVTNESSYGYVMFHSYMCPYMVGAGYAGLGDVILIDANLYKKIDNNDIRKAWWGTALAPGMAPENVIPEGWVANGWAPTVPNKFIAGALMGSGFYEEDILWYRGAEAYFVAAEAYYLNKDEANAKKALNAIMASRIPGYDCKLSGEALYEEICLQKRIEFWGEGKRFFDVKRRNELVDRTASNHMPANIIINQNYNGQDDLMIWQIPQKEMDNNNDITPDQQNP